MKKAAAILFVLASLINLSNSQPTWTDISIPNLQTIPLNSVSTISGSIVWAAGFNRTVVFTSNGGVNWVNRGGTIPGNPDIYVIAAIDANTAFIGANVIAPATAYIYQTTNGGVNWIPRFVQPGGFINDIKIVNPNFYFAYGNPVGGKWTLLRSLNAGLFWDTTGLLLPGQSNHQGDWNGMAFYPTLSGGTLFWFATNLGGVFHSANSGSTWTFQTVPGAQITYSISFSDANTGFCSGDNNMYSTTNGGVTWVIAPNLPGTGPCYTIANSAGRFWYARGNTIYYSVNSQPFVPQHVFGGQTGYRHMSFVYSPFSNIESTVGGWAITGEMVISNYTDNSIGVVQIGTEVPAKYSLSQNFPNPFNPSTKIRFTIPNTGSETPYVRLIVYDILGREASTIVNSNLRPGDYEADWDASNYPSGIYFYTLSSSKFTSTKKMIVLK
jgi:photosystem II stability/assembly factor-like uncharacterized protein